MMNMAENIDMQQYVDDLVRRARADSEALGGLYEIYYERIFRFCLRRLYVREAAEDVTSQVFLKVARHLPTFRGETGADFQNWLYVIASNQVNSWFRKKGRRDRIMAQVAESLVKDDPVENHEHLDWPVLYKSLAKLKPDQQTMVTLRYFEGMNYDEIGRVVDITPSAARVKLHRAVRKLRQVYESESGGTQ